MVPHFFLLTSSFNLFVASSFFSANGRIRRGELQPFLASHQKVSELSSNSPLAFSLFDDVVAAWA
jgi:hypothetical protein